MRRTKYVESVNCSKDALKPTLAKFRLRTRHVGLFGDFDGPFPSRALDRRLVLRVDQLLTSHVECLACLPRARKGDLCERKSWVKRRKLDCSCGVRAGRDERGCGRRGLCEFS